MGWGWMGIEAQMNVHVVQMCLALPCLLFFSPLIFLKDHGQHRVYMGEFVCGRYFFSNLFPEGTG